MSEHLNAAVALASRGFCIFPVTSTGKKKRPLVESWQNIATKDLAQIQVWWTQWPDANIGMACGKSGVFVLDVDVSDGKPGLESLGKLEAEYAKIPETMQVKTGSGGIHFFFRYTLNRSVGNRGHFLPGLDVRGDGGYVILPPSIHETNNLYEWVKEIAPAECPLPILDLIAPEKKIIPPWTQVAKTQPLKRVTTDHRTPILERAALYLAQCEPAIEGQGGHNSLLWAARAMVVGFELSDYDALSLLWSEFNPRCMPSWDFGKPSDCKDFERKVTEARTVRFDKPQGWLLTECGLRSDDDALASMIGDSFAENYTNRMAPQKSEQIYASETSEQETAPTHEKFPLHCLPEQVREYIELVADVQVVDTAGIALSVLIAAGASMGNAFRFRLKEGYDLPPILWGAIISRSGSNKSGPFREIIKPLRAKVPVGQIENMIINPQGQLLVEDVTTESLIEVMTNSPRGLCLANGEGAGWIGAFDRYSQGSKKKVSVDETIWLKLWDCDTYQKNRKTNSENVLIHNAACGVLVCIQPKKMAECFDPAQFASGLVPRLLVVHLPKTFRAWSERAMTKDNTKWWKETIMRLRSFSFANWDPNNGEYFPNIINQSAQAKERYVAEFNRLAKEISQANDMSELFLGKAQGMIGRIALVLHGLGAACGLYDIKNEISEETMNNAIEIMQYFTAQQLSVYNLAGESYTQKRTAELLDLATKKKGILTPRELTRANNRKWATAEIGARDLEKMAEAGYGTWNAVQKLFVLKQ